MRDPILKWAGGKRWLTTSYPWLFPQSFDRYLEPFLGGASVFLWLSPARAVLSDVNERLIAMYMAVRDDWEAVWDALVGFAEQHSDENYYLVRGRIDSDRFREAARFLYLNRTCWNGLYRVNRKGQFNVPRGSKERVLFGKADIEAVSDMLDRSAMGCRDFQGTIDLAGAGDFVFVDPPYTVSHSANGFLKYNESIFSWSDQIRLRDAVQGASRRGASVLVLNAHHDSLTDLYAGLGVQHTLTRHSVMSGRAEFRKPVQELAIQVGYSTDRADTLDAYGILLNPVLQSYS
jgi:DNA adenine methylase